MASATSRARGVMDSVQLERDRDALPVGDEPDRAKDACERRDERGETAGQPRERRDEGGTVVDEDGVVAPPVQVTETGTRPGQVGAPAGPQVACGEGRPPRDFREVEAAEALQRGPDRHLTLPALRGRSEV